jgi:predicted nucleic acid-binding protein
MTSPRILQYPLPMRDAWVQVTAWHSADPAWVPQPTERHSEVFGRLLALPGIRGNLVHDAHLAALAIEHGLTLCSTDGDFARFPGLRWLNPLT